MAKIRTKYEKKELNNKIAEIIWLSLGGIIFVSGLISGLLGLIINNIGGNRTKSPLYFLIQAEENFFAWVKTWWTDYSLTNFSTTGLALMIIGLVVLLLVLLVFSNRSEAMKSKEKARKLREKNVRRYEEQFKDIRNQNSTPAQ